MQQKRNHTGIVVRHSRSCPSRSGEKCSEGRKDGCRPSFEAWVFDRREGGSKIRKTFPTVAAAKAWRTDAQSALNRGRLGTTRLTLRDAGEAWLADAKAEPPVILRRGGWPYKPSVLRGYEADLRNYVFPELGAHRLSDVRRKDVQALVDRLQGRGLSGSKARNVVMPLRALYRHHRDDVNENPTQGVSFASPVGRRDRVASPNEAAVLLAVLPMPDRALWGTAFYAGLRLGELQALRWSDVDLALNEIRVERGWDPKDGFIAPKSEKGTRTTPVVGVLHELLTELKASSGRDGHELVFGSRPGHPFTPSYIRKRAAKVWETANTERKENRLEAVLPIRLHECRHTCVSMLHAAGIPLERIGDYVGHSSTYMTDRYRHLLPDQREEDRRRADDFLALADSEARIAQVAIPAD